MNSDESMPRENCEVQRFWNNNPCGGKWDSYHDLINWVKKTDGYAFSVMTQEVLDDKKVLEVGCGQGMLLVHCAQYCRCIVGIDLSLESVSVTTNAIAEYGLKNAIAVQGNAECIQFEDSSFDLVYSFGVLHHTQNTEKAIDEIYRLLKPNGLFIVMLYKKYTPKWCVLRLIRAISKFIDILTGKKSYLYRKLLLKTSETNNSVKGTALHELLGCPIIKTYSKGGIKSLLSKFASVRIKAYEPGFKRIADIMPTWLMTKSILKVLSWIDEHTNKIFGFYWVAECRKQAISKFTN